MPIARRLEWYLDAAGVDYEVLPHPHSSCSVQTARRSRIPLFRLAKAVLLEDDSGYVMAILPAARRVDLARLRQELGRDLELASEAELNDLFDDCAPGAMPALGTAYQIPTIYDDSLVGLSDVYFEAGDHDDIVHMSGDAYLDLLSGSRHGRFSRQLSGGSGRA